MTDKELKKKWTELQIEPKAKIRANMESEIKEFENRISYRDRREIITASAMIIFFSTSAFLTTGYERIGAMFLVAYCIWIIFYLVKVRVQKSLSYFDSLNDQLISLKKYAIAQRNLVKNVLFWYLLPMIPGIVFFLLGMQSIFAKGAIIIFVIFTFTYIYKLNRRAARENYDHLLQQLDSAIAGLQV